MRVAIVHRSRESAELLKTVIGGVRRATVAWVAHDGLEAVRACKENRPDLVLMAIDLPKLDGLAATRRIMAEAPCAVLVVAPAISASISKVYDAMSAGAVNAVDMPTAVADGRVKGAEMLLEKIGLVKKLVGKANASERSLRVQDRDRLPPIVALGASTGGPQALASVIEVFPADLDAAVVVVQHFDQQYAQGFVEWLRPRSKLPVQLVREGAGPARGVVLVGATNDHLIMDDTRALSYTPHPRAKAYRPSVDVFFQSLVNHWPRPSVAALLTGMGRDGAEGLMELRKRGWLTLAQDEKTSVVFGMPKAAAEIGAAVRVLPIGEIGQAIVGFVRKGK